MAALPAMPMPWGRLRASAALFAIMEALLLELAVSGSAMAALASTGCARGPMHSDPPDPSLVSSAEQDWLLSRQDRAGCPEPSLVSSAEPHWLLSR